MPSGESICEQIADLEGGESDLDGGESDLEVGVFGTL